MEPSFEIEVNQFVERIESLRVTLPIMAKVICDTTQKAKVDFDNYLSENDIEKNEKDGKVNYVVPPEKLTKFCNLQNEIKSAELAKSFVPPTFLVALVSQYDAYLGRLIRVIFHTKSELLSSSERQMTFAQLSKFDTLDDVKEYIVEQEIDSVLRKSHTDQINWFENKLKMTLTKNLEVWQDFVEVTERRNLFVHADGVISSQYLKVCKEHGVQLDKGAANYRKLSVSLSYFEKACNCIFEMGVKLAHAIWRKLDPKHIENSDQNLYDLCCNLIEAENYPLAIILLNFATDTLKKHSSERMALLFSIAKAQALKWDGQEEECRCELSSKDWSAKGPEFNLSRSILEENYEEAVQIMKSIGRNGKVSEVDYKTLPLFKKFRKTGLFLSMYEEIFGEKFNGASESESKIEIPSKDLEPKFLGRDLDRFKYDISQSIEIGIRKCCVGSDSFPPLEIRTDETSSSLLRFLVAFESSKDHGLSCSFIVIINVELVDLRVQTVKLSCSGVLTKGDIFSHSPPNFNTFFEGVYDEGIIWNELDQVFYQLIDKAIKAESKALKENKLIDPIWVTL